MAGSYGYIWEKFYQAVNGLVASQRSLQERIAGAYVYHLMQAEHHGLPPEIQDAFAELKAAVSSVADDPSGEGTVMASARKLTELEAHRILELIVSMYDSVTKYGPNSRE